MRDPRSRPAGHDHEERPQQESEDADEQPTTLAEAFDQWTLEAAVLSTETERKALYRAVTPDEIEPLKSAAK